MRKTLAGLAMLFVLVPVGIAQHANAATITEFPLPDAGLKQPEAIAAGPDGNLWFAEADWGTIGKVTPSGAITEYPYDNTANSFPKGIVGGPDGNLWFTSRPDEIGRLTPAGVFTHFPLDASVGHPSGITRASDGNLWFAAEDAVGRITPGGVVTTFALDASHMAQDIVEGPGGQIWFTDPLSRSVGHLPLTAVSNAQITFLALPGAGAEPWGIATGPDGQGGRALWVTDDGTHSVLRIPPSATTDSDVVEFALPDGTIEVRDIAEGTDGAMYVPVHIEVNSVDGDAVLRIDPQAGVTAEYPLPTENGKPRGIALGPDSNLWFTESATDIIGRLVIDLTPGLQTLPPDAVTKTSAELRGAVNPNGSATTYRFEYRAEGETTARTTPAASAGSGSALVPVDATVSDLAPDTTYRFRLIASNATGPAQATERSFATATARPVNTAKPEIGGPPTGEGPAAGDNLACTPGTWTNDPTGYAFEWLRDGQPIPGATGSSYVIADADEEHNLACRVTAANAAGPGSAALSDALGIPAGVGPQADLVVGPQHPAVGEDVVLDASASAGTGLTYRWTTDVPGKETLDTGQRSTLTLRFDTAGAHEVSVTITDRRGRVASLRRTLQIATPHLYRATIDPPVPVAGQPASVTIRRVDLVTGRSRPLPTGSLATIDGPRGMMVLKQQALSALGTELEVDGRAMSSSGDFRLKLPAGQPELRLAVTDPDGATQNAMIELPVARDEKSEQSVIPPVCFTFTDPPIPDQDLEFHDCTPHNVEWTTRKVLASEKFLLPWEIYMGDPAPYVLGRSPEVELKGYPALKLSGGGMRPRAYSSIVTTKTYKITDKITWEFQEADGSTTTAKGQEVTHKWKSPGDYNVTLKVDFFRTESKYANGLQAIQDSGNNLNEIDAGKTTLVGSDKAEAIVHVVAPVRGPIDVKGVPVRSLDGSFYPVLSQGTMPDGSPKVYATSKERPGALQGVAIGSLQIKQDTAIEYGPKDRMSDAIWINRDTGYLGPFPSRGLDASYESQFIVKGRPVPVGDLVEPLMISGGRQLLAPFDGLQHVGNEPVTVAGLPLFRDPATKAVARPQLALAPGGGEPATVVWPLRMPGPMGVKVVAEQSGHPELPVATMLSATDIAARTRNVFDALGDVEFDLELDEFNIGPLNAGPFELHHKATGDYSWYGGGQIKLPVALADGLKIDGSYNEKEGNGFALRRDGSIAFIGATVPISPPIVIAGLVDLDDVHFAFGTDPFFLSGEARFSNVGVPDIVVVHGCVSYIYGKNSKRKLPLCRQGKFGGAVDDTNGVRVRIAGQLDVELGGFSETLGAAFVQFDEDEGLTLRAETDFSLDILGYELGHIHAALEAGFKSWDRFRIWGEASASIGIIDAEGGLGLTNDGLGGCLGGSVLGSPKLWLGFTYVRGDFDAGLYGCGEVRGALGFTRSAPRISEPNPLGPLHAARTGTFTARESDDHLEIIVKGQNASPRVTLTSPSGKTITDTGADGSLGAGTGVVHFAKARTTAIVIEDPEPGQWKIDSGDETMIELQVADVAPEPKVTGRVTGSGSRRALRYDAKLSEGERMAFTQTGGAPLGGERGSGSGRIAFSPAAGEDRRREIVAIVTRDGLPVSRKVIARFTADKPHRLVLRGLRVRAKGSVARVSWRPVPGARGYVVASRLRLAGARVRRLGRKARGTTLAVRPADAGRVTVTPLGAPGQSVRGASRVVKRRPNEIAPARI